jgi:hypothetical protein
MIMRSSNPAYTLPQDEVLGLAVPSKAATRRGAKQSDAKQARLRNSLIAFALLLGLCASSLLVSVAARWSRAPGLRDTGPTSATITLASPQGGGCARMMFDNASGRMAKVDILCGDVQRDANGNPVYRGTVDRLDQIARSFQNR